MSIFLLSALDSASVSREAVGMSPVYYCLLLCVFEKKPFLRLPLLEYNTLTERISAFFKTTTIRFFFKLPPLDYYILSERIAAFIGLTKFDS